MPSLAFTNLVSTVLAFYLYQDGNVVASVCCLVYFRFSRINVHEISGFWKVKAFG